MQGRMIMTAMSVTPKQKRKPYRIFFNLAPSFSVLGKQVMMNYPSSLRSISAA